MPRLSVARTTSVPVDPGAVNEPDAELIEPEPETIPYVTVPTPPLVLNPFVLPTASVNEAGDIASADATVNVAFDVLPKLSVARTTSVPTVPGAVNEPDVALIEPEPDTIPYVTVPTPPLALKPFVLPTASVNDAGEIASASKYVNPEFNVAAEVPTATTTFTATPAVPAGASATSDVEDTNVTVVAGCAPNETEVVPA